MDTEGRILGGKERRMVKILNLTNEAKSEKERQGHVPDSNSLQVASASLQGGGNIKAVCRGS